MSIYRVGSEEEVEHISNRLEFLGADDIGGRKIARYRITTAYGGEERWEEISYEVGAGQDMDQIVEIHKNLVQKRFGQIKGEMRYALRKSSLIPVCLVCINKELITEIA
jgi:hypothetical protein